MPQHIRACSEKIVNCEYVMGNGIARNHGYQYEHVYVFQYCTTVNTSILMSLKETWHRKVWISG